MPEDHRLAVIELTDLVENAAALGSDEDKAIKNLRKKREAQKPVLKISDFP